MQTNVDVLDQYVLSIQKTASRMIELCLGSRWFPADDVAAGVLGPRWPRRGTDGSNGAVASIVGSAAAPLE